MSDIKVGDMVMVVRGTPCCGSTDFVFFGLPFVVAKLTTTPFDLQCKFCGSPIKAGTAFAQNDDGKIGGPLSMLKKLDPPAEGDSLPTRADLEITA